MFSELSVYKEISFFKQGVGSASSRSALFSGRAGALTWVSMLSGKIKSPNRV